MLSAGQPVSSVQSSAARPCTQAPALAASYPQDQATGFGAGDLRGWMWAEVPKTK